MNCQEVHGMPKKIYTTLYSHWLQISTIKMINASTISLNAFFHVLTGLNAFYLVYLHFKDLFSHLDPVIRIGYTRHERRYMILKA